jgi:ornithine cyclodeaminase/alanine dehydrogenase-like protein (mu-crystallin family)
MTTPIVVGGARNQLATHGLASEPVDGVNSDCATSGGYVDWEQEVAQVLRVGVLGAGWAGTGHTAAYRHLPDVEVCALWSRSSDRADALASALDSPTLQVYQEWGELITRGGCDVISIATPPMLRSGPLPAGLGIRLSCLARQSNAEWR